MKRQRAEISSNVISHIKSAHPIEMWRSNKLGIKEKVSRGNFPRLIFSCPVPSGLPHRSHCVPMNMNPCGYRFSWWRIAGSNRWPLDCQNLTFPGVCIMYSFFKKYRRKNRTKTEKIFLYFLSSIFCFNMTDCIPCFLLYKEFKSGPLFERDRLQNHSNSRLFGYSILSKLVISFCRMHEPKLWFRILLCRDKSCDFVAVSARRNLWFCHVECGLFLDKTCDSVI